MVVLKRHSKKSSRKDRFFLGVFLPRKPSIYLSLFCAGEGISKSSVMVNVIHDWYLDSSEKVTEQDLIEKITKRAVEIWKEGTPQIPLKSFVPLLQKDLKKRNIDLSTIELILNQFTDEANKGKKG